MTTTGTIQATGTTAASPPAVPFVRFQAPPAPERTPLPEPPRPQPADKPPPAKGLKESVERANQLAQQRSIDLQFGIHEGSGEFYVRVLDSRTREVIKTVPPEELLDLHARIERSLGILFDTTA